MHPRRLSRLLPPALRVLSISVLLSHRRWLSPPAQILLSCSPLSLVALDSTLPNLCACESPVHILLVPLHPGFPTGKLSAPAPYPTLPALGKKGGAVTADSPCSCTAESRDCRARTSLHVGDRYPIASRRSCCSTSARMSVFSSLAFFFPTCRKWLYTLLMIVQLLSTSVHVVDPW